MMKTLATRSGVRVGGVALLALTTAATACTGRQQEAPPAATTAASPPPPPRPTCLHPDTASPLDALPEAVRLVADKPFTGDFDGIRQAPRDSRGRDVRTAMHDSSTRGKSVG